VTEDPDGLAAAPSRFWQKIGSDHDLAAGRSGIDTVKREQALRYFTWSWQWSGLRHNPQARFLIRNSSLRAFRNAVSQPIRLSDDDWAGIPWPRRDRWLYTVAVRLLWQYAEQHGDPEVLALDEPALGNPLPVTLDDRLISQDLANTSLEVASMREMLGGRAATEILEVGAGYGRNAHALLSIFPNASYTIIDVEPALSIARWYLEALVSPTRLRFVSPTDMDTVRKQRFDLALSISSLAEMTRENQAAYISLFDEAAAGGHVYLKQYLQYMNVEDWVLFEFFRLPIPRSWESAFCRAPAVQTMFIEAGWRVGDSS